MVCRNIENLMCPEVEENKGDWNEQRQNLNRQFGDRPECLISQFNFGVNTPEVHACCHQNVVKGFEKPGDADVWRSAHRPAVDDSEQIVGDKGTGERKQH